MTKIIKEREQMEKAFYVHSFARVGDPESGWQFDVNQDGEYKPMAKEVAESLQYCLDNPDKVRDEGIKKYYRRWTEPAILECDCGEQVPLEGFTNGASQCPVCGRWYNMFGQELSGPYGSDEEW